MEELKTAVNNNRFATKICSLEKLGGTRYLIPTYQRPYVWQYAQIKKLLEDFWSAFTRGDEHYFIGTIMTSSQNNKEELIDGQQRFTTLWLIAVAFKSLCVNSDIIYFLKANNELRFDFTIREKLKDYLTLLMEDKKLAIQKYPEKDIENDEFLKHIASAITTIHNIIESNSYNGHHTIEGFASYIFKQVQFVKNTTPKGINLNKLFTTINNSGVQLEQTDILKANLLRHIKSEKLLYSKIWEACENMENYFERNVRKLFKESNWAEISLEDFKKFDRNKFLFRQAESIGNIDITKEYHQTHGGQALQEILEEAEVKDSAWYTQEISDNVISNSGEVERCESILSFGQLLLHTYRIFLYQSECEDFSLPFHVNNLLSIFKALEGEEKDKETREKRIKSYFECLWQVRYAFDRYVIKWVEKPGEKERYLMLMNLNKDKDNHQLKYSQKEKNDLSMLQSVLYFTSNYNTQIWLSPFLKRILEGEDPLTCLENIDNELSLSTIEDKETTYLLMERDAIIPFKLALKIRLHSYSYPKFKHYWFQKLEYILWKNWKKKEDPKFKEYRITSKNSVEHVFPQKHEFGETINGNTLHCFGNLALLNVSQNSSYSDQDVGKKKIDFFSSAKTSYDSLKLYHIYNDDTLKSWKEIDIQNHQAAMINLILSHYSL